MSSAPLSRSPPFGAAPCVLAIRRTRERSMTTISFLAGKTLRCPLMITKFLQDTIQRRFITCKSKKLPVHGYSVRPQISYFPASIRAAQVDDQHYSAVTSTGMKKRRQPFRTDLCNSRTRMLTTLVEDPIALTAETITTFALTNQCLPY